MQLDPLTACHQTVARGCEEYVVAFLIKDIMKSVQYTQGW